MRFFSALRIATLFIFMIACGDDPSADETSFIVDGDTAVNEDLEPPAEAPTPIATELEVVNEVVEDFLGEYPSLRGAGVIALHKDRGVIHRKAYGDFATDRVYLIASSSKMVSAGILNRLNDDGALDLYAPIAEVVDWGQSRPLIKPVHLLSNTSGLPALFSTTFFGDHRCQLFSAGELTDCAETIFQTEPNGQDTIVPPDTDFRYGGGQWQVAGGIAELASGKSWAELFHEIYVQPCGLQSSGFTHPFQFGLTLSGYPSGFTGDISTIMPTNNPFIEAGMYTTIDDYGRLLMMHLNGGRCGENAVHTEEAIARMHAEYVRNTFMGETNAARLFDENVGWSGYGMGWWIDRDFSSINFDPGIYGSVALINWDTNIAIFAVIEGTIKPEGTDLYSRMRALSQDMDF